MSAEKQPSIEISNVEFSDGTDLQLSTSDTVVFVGSNNVGKSASLREIVAKCEGHEATGTIVKSVSLDVQGTVEDLTQQIESSSLAFDQHGIRHYRLPNTQLAASNLEVFWNNGRTQHGLGPLSVLFVHHLDAASRSSISNPVASIDFRREPATHPLHTLYQSEETEKRVSELFRQAFGQDLVLDLHAGSVIPLLYGERPQIQEGESFRSESVRQQFALLPELSTQGDGVRCFAGILLYCFVTPFNIISIDEPEAFLHPPQARLLGQMLARPADHKRQMLVATHSGDLLRGLLDGDQGNVRIVRIKREGNINPISELKNEDIRALWGDPLLRYSNILDGLFHERVVVCEADTDCRFYAAVMDSVCSSPEQQRPDIMFTHCGGKHRVDKVTRALHRLDVPVSVVVDMDILNDKEPLKRIFESLGGQWTDIQSDWLLVKADVERRVSGDSADVIKRQIQEALRAVPNKGVFPDEAKERIKSALKNANSPWSVVKRYGEDAFVGESRGAYGRLNQALHSHGIFIVPVGELERFDRSAPESLHGPAWLNHVLSKGDQHLLSLSEARNFVQAVLGEVRS